MNLRPKCLALVLAWIGLFAHAAPTCCQTRTPSRNVEPGLVILVEGIGGWDIFNKSGAFSVKHAGLPHEVHRFTWTHGTGKLLRDLQDTQHILKKADELAAFVRDYHARNPDRPIYIVSRSGGTGVVLFALQALPANTVERVILLSAAVSPSFDLRPALRATRREIVSFHSRNDRFVLSWGTKNFGTADRFYGPSAGHTGFRIPERLDDADHELYRRLIQVPYSSRMFREGAGTGSHTSTGMPWFLASEVVPWLR